MLTSRLCDYGGAYIFVKENTTVNNTAVADPDANNTGKKNIFKNCAQFTYCISKINNTQVDNFKDIDIVMSMYNLKYSDNYSSRNTSCKDVPAIKNNGNIVEFNGTNATNSFNSKTKIIGQIIDNGVINVEIMVPLKYLSNS